MIRKPTYEELECRIRELENAESETRKILNMHDKLKLNYRDIFEAINDAIFIHDAQSGRILDVNQRTLEMYGYSKEEIIQLDVEALSQGISPYGKAEAKNNIQKAAKGEPHLFEWRAKRKNDDLFWVEVNLKIVPFEGQKCVIAIVRDISARKKTEEALRLTQYTIDKTVDQAFWMTADSQLFYVNDAACKTLGYPREELLKLSIPDIDPFVSSDVFARFWPKLKKNGSDTLETFHRTKNGHIYPVEIRANYVVFDGKEYNCAFATDITERKRMEQSLKDSEGFLRALLQTIPFLIWLKDPNGAFLACNEMFERFIGAKEENIVGKTDYDFVEKDLADFFREQDRKAVAAGKPTSNEEWVTFAASGQLVLLETMKTPMLDDQGNLVGVLGIAHDITERKKAEEEKVKLKGQLQQAQKMEAVGRLAGGVAHDFNNMLSVIIGYGELALERTDHTEQLRTELQEIMEAAYRSADITRQLLAFARKQTISPKVLDINKTVESLTKMLQRLIGEDIELAWMPGEAVGMTKIDPGQVDQILVNLCLNARDAIKDVGRIIIETGNVNFDENYCSHHFRFIPGEYILLAISDNGYGMDAETLDNIFDPFFTTKEAGKGTGLGLAMVYGIVNQNNGFINVCSELGQGSSFKIYLPRHRAGAPDFLPSEGNDFRVPCGCETILLAEDELAILKMAVTMLESLGYAVLAARTPGEAIRLAEEHDGAIDLLLTDVVMPEMNGRLLVKKILAIHPDLEYLFMSGYTANVIAHHGVLDEGVNFIQKPFSKNELGAKVREALDGRIPSRRKSQSI